MICKQRHQENTFYRKILALSQQTHWDGRDDEGQALASGLYFFALKSDDGYSDIKKMALLK